MQNVLIVNHPVYKYIILYYYLYYICIYAIISTDTTLKTAQERSYSFPKFSYEPKDITVYYIRYMPLYIDNTIELRTSVVYNNNNNNSNMVIVHGSPWNT